MSDSPGAKAEEKAKAPAAHDKTTIDQVEDVPDPDEDDLDDLDGKPLCAILFYVSPDEYRHAGRVLVGETRHETTC